MGGVQAIVMGSIIGFMGAVPSAYVLERALGKERKASIALGIASIMVSFTMLTAAIFVVWLVARDNVLFFGVAEVASFLLIWVVEAWRAWRDAQRGASPGERKSGEPTRAA